VPALGGQWWGHLVDLAAVPFAVLGTPTERHTMRQRVEIFQFNRTVQDLWAGSDPGMCVPRGLPVASAGTHRHSALAHCWRSVRFPRTQRFPPANHGKNIE
jgi:hypothetical protein